MVASVMQLETVPGQLVALVAPHRCLHTAMQAPWVSQAAALSMLLS